MYRLTFLLCLLTQICCVASPNISRISAGEFSADVGRKLAIYYKNKIIVSRDSCDDGQNKLIDTQQGEIYKQGNTYTLIYKTGNNSFRREVAVRPNEVEITFRVLVRRPISSSLMYYRLHCPKDVFDGANYDYLAGWVSRKPKYGAGTFDYANDVKKQLSFGNIRYLHIKAKDLAISFDFNPEGPWLCYGGNYSRMWGCYIATDEKGYCISRIRTYSRFGNLLIGKIIIRAGVVPYEKIHPIKRFAYTSDVKRNLVINFSYDKDEMEYKSCNPKTKLSSIYWENPQNLQIISRNSRDFVYKDFITPKISNSPTLLIIKNQPAGLYWLTLTIFDPKAETGTFSVFSDNKTLLENARIKAGEYWIKTIPIWIKKDGVRIKFVGNWKLNALALQLIMGENEDYQFKRSYWNMKIFH